MSRRIPNPAADRAAQNQQTIKTLLKLEGNKSCADCKRNKRMLTAAHSCFPWGILLITKTDPRWASWNLGVFVCIRYAFKSNLPLLCHLLMAEDVPAYIVGWERTSVG